MHSNSRLRAAKSGYIVISALMAVLGAVLMAVPGFSILLLCRLGGVLLILFGIIKVVGYFSQDLYRLAFQYDLAVGILLIALGTILLVRTPAVTSLVCVLLGVYTLADGLLKIQISVDARTFGIRQWWMILIAAVLTGAVGFLLTFRPWESGRAIMRLLGLALLLEGILNMITILTSVKIHRQQSATDAGENM